MKYILVGGSGFIGQHFKRKLGDKIILNLDLDEGINNSHFSKCDILNFNELDKFSKKISEKTTLIHLAAVHFDFQRKYFPTNVEGTKNILRFINNNKNIVKYVFFSSVATFGNSEHGKHEKSSQIPINDYGKSKLEAEKLILDWKKKTNKKLDIIIIRPAVVFGEYNFGNVFNLIQQIKSGLFAIIGSGKNIKSIAYAGNIVDSVLFCLNNINDDTYIYNYCDYPQMNISEQVKTLNSLTFNKKIFRIPLLLTKLFTLPIDLLENLFGIDLKINSMRVKKFTMPTYFCSDKIRKDGFIQKVSIEESFNNTLNWINNVNVSELRKKWYKKASKL